MLFDKIKQDLITAIKALDKRRVSILRFLVSEIKNLEIENYPPGKSGALTEEEVLSVLSKQAKNRKESIMMFEKGGRGDLVAQEKEELAVINSYLPAQIGEEEIRIAVKEILAGKTENNFGKIMGMVMAKLKGQADGNTVSSIVKEEMGLK